MVIGPNVLFALLGFETRELNLADIMVGEINSLAV